MVDQQVLPCRKRGESVAAILLDHSTTSSFDHLLAASRSGTSALTVPTLSPSWQARSSQLNLQRGWQARSWQSIVWTLALSTPKCYMQARAFILNEECSMQRSCCAILLVSTLLFLAPGSWAQPGPWLSLAYTDFKCVPRIYYATEQVPLASTHCVAAGRLGPLWHEPERRQ